MLLMGGMRRSDECRVAGKAWNTVGERMGEVNEHELFKLTTRCLRVK